MRVGVVGATGYAGAELIRLLIRHPRVELAKITSNSQSGTRLDALHPALLGCTDLVAEAFDPDALAELDAVLIGVPHGKAAPLCDALDAAGAKRIFDLSRDHRHAVLKINTQSTAADYYFSTPLSKIALKCDEM